MSNIPIFLASDNNYAPFVATTIASICDNTKSFCNFYILDGGISKKNKDKINFLKKQFFNFSIHYIEIDIKKYFSSLVESECFSKSMYSRFLIPDLLPELDKVIYSDVDVIVTGDIQEMYDEDLGEYALGAVWEEFFEKYWNIKRKEYMEIDMEHKYFSSGNLLINCSKWRENKVFLGLIDIGLKYEDNLLWPDMDILNKYFENNYKQLNRKYCFVDPCYDVFGKEKFIIRHFTGVLKPWKVHPDLKLDFLPDTQLFWKYAKKTLFYNELLDNVVLKNYKDAMPYKVFTILKKKEI